MIKHIYICTNIECMSQNTEKNNQIGKQTIRVFYNDSINKSIEILLWIFTSILVITPSLISYNSPNVYSYLTESNIDFDQKIWIKDNYIDIIVSFLIIVIPTFYKLVFGVLPIESLRLILFNNRNNKLHNKNEEDDIKSKIIVSLKKNYTNENLANAINNEGNILESYMNKSENISKSIFNRANSYLFIGSIIALLGVLFFYFQSIDVANEFSKANAAMNNSLLILEILPRVGSLIFVESIAFFFLRLYRRNMEEFRYYDSIARQRENQFIIFKLSEDYKNNIEHFESLINLFSFNNDPNKMTKEETNSIIESEKVFGKESEFLNKLIEIIKAAKK